MTVNEAGTLAGAVARLTSDAKEFDLFGVGPNLPRHTADLRTVLDALKARDAEIDKLRGAISWVVPPFIDETTQEAEIRKRIAFLRADAERAKPDQATLSGGRRRVADSSEPPQ